MRNPEQALEQLRAVWCRRAGEWLGGAGTWPLRIPLRAPGEQQAGAAWSDFERWRGLWRQWGGGGDVRWIERRWPLFGTQSLPDVWLLHGADMVASILGEGERWERAETRFGILASRWPALVLRLRRQFDLLADMGGDDYRRLIDMLTWLLAHPQSGLFLRQLPVVGVDSKWLESHLGIIGEWLRLLHPSAEAQTDFWVLSGLRRDADRLRLRILDPGLRACVGGLGDIHAPWQQLAALPWPVRRVFIVENKQTGLAFQDLPDAVVLMARGYAVEQLAALPWVRQAQAVYYWGDIDTHGLAILGRLRSHLPQVHSLMMDEATLQAHRELCVTEPDPHRATEIEHLHAHEQAVYHGLTTGRWGVRLRLEQERINWDYVWSRLLALRE
ncbi:DUF2220 family protein [Frateuria edaphi]|uniref:Wadjet anti-phage system protein JetD domain-containing protein n=1 Tax=Frateuria edaphi TaxID=2898793 RepID=UPI001E2F9CA2|nr:DUF3322 and DUF2220 domain-containing protein [Frateuria edaphi]UGB47516.1 DUF2220 family protein [Frateuria edaphi]